MGFAIYLLKANMILSVLFGAYWCLLVLIKKGALFSAEPIKLRIKMMNTNKFSRFGLLKYAFMFPLLVGLYFLIQPQQIQAQTIAISKSSNSASNTYPAGKDNIYLKINPGLSREVIDDIIVELKKYNVFLKVNNKNYNDGLLTAIDIDIETPGHFHSHISEEGSQVSFTPLVFAYETDHGQSTSFTKGIPQQISDRGKKILTQNLLSGLSILRKDGSMRTIGAFHIDD